MLPDIKELVIGIDVLKHQIFTTGEGTMIEVHVNISAEILPKDLANRVHKQLSISRDQL
jgi:hypothetical protein